MVSATLAPAERHERATKVHLGPGPFERDALAGSLLQCEAEGLNGLLQMVSPTFALSKPLERNAQVQLSPGPFEREEPTGKLLENESVKPYRICERGIVTAFIS